VGGGGGGGGGRGPRQLLKSSAIVMNRDVKNIRTRGYPWIKPAMDRKWILKMDTRYPRLRVFLIPAC